jgi:hypothetical protein
MPWTVEDIEKEWLNGERLELPADDVLRAFAVADEVRGRDWVLSTTQLPGGGRLWGLGALWPLYWFGTRMQVAAGAPGIETLIRRLQGNDAAANSELTALYILRGQKLARDLEIEPQVASRKSFRLPDFRIREDAAPWTYVEVTSLRSSFASERAHRLLNRIVDAVMEVERPFILEAVLQRFPTEDEEQKLVQTAFEASQASKERQVSVGDFARVLIKTGHPTRIVPTPIPEDSVPRLAVAKGIAGPGEVGRQVIVRAPFADERAEDVLTREAKQLPRQECGLVMVDVGGQPSALDSWPQLIPPRFTSSQHTRVAGVLLFMTGMTLTTGGLKTLIYPKLIINPHANAPLPRWIIEVVDRIRAENRRATGRPD